jgi:hypothetical protein
MINFPPTLPATTATPPSNKSPSRRISPSSNLNKRAYQILDRRRMRDRRSRRGGSQLIDRRYRPERRRSSIDVSV